MISVIMNIFKSKRRYLIFLIMLTLCFLMMLVLVNTKKYYQNILENEMGAELINRKLVVINTEEGVSDSIKKAPNVIDFYPFVFLNGSVDELAFDLGYVTDYEYKLLQGKKINQKDEILVPKELKDFLNEWINIEINQVNYNFKVVGVSDSNSMILSREFLNEFIAHSDIPIGYYVLIADNYKCAQKDIDYFSDKGYMASLQNTDGLGEYNKMQNFISMLTKFIYFLIIFSLIFMIYIIKNIFHMEAKNMAILKAVGYSDLKIGIVIISKILILLLISMFISIVIFVVVTYLLSCFLNSDYLSFSKKCQFMNDYILLCFTSVILLVLNYIPIFLKIRKLDVVKILSEE